MVRRPVESVLVAVATCGRPAFLRNCLRSIQQLDVPAGMKLEVLLVDNNPGGDARPLADELGADAPHPLHYAHVPERGIVHGRNRAVEEAVARGVDLLGFLDDDGIVHESWLHELLEVLDTAQADVVGGPAHFRYPDNCPGWFERFHSQFSWPSGLLEYEGFHTLPATRNVVFRTHLIGEWGLRFHQDFNLCGGEDTFFFEEARRRGAVIAWAPEARVEEEFPASRANLRWVLQRRYRHGSNRIQFLRLLGEAPPRGPLVRQKLRTVWSAWVSRPLSRLWKRERDQVVWVRTLGDMADALGELLQSLGYSYAEYRTIHGG